ncbi:MAG: carbamate kinase [Candidatus Sedimenticola sp. (ex Thyasira tokunagai)]
MKVVIGLGGNALLRRGQPMEANLQHRNIEAAAEAVARVARKHTVILTHGNGPQVGLLALQSAAYKGVRPYPLDLLSAQTEGMLGYLLEQELGNRLPEKALATLLTQVEVDPTDPAFERPEKFIGPVYDQREADAVKQKYGWALACDGKRFRRVVPSPRPQRIIELSTISMLAEAGALVICTGGGGIPVVVTPDGGLMGVEAVIDKDYSTAMLAVELKADRLLLLTDVDAVYAEWKKETARPFRSTSPRVLGRYLFAKGSMGPKVEAACDFVQRTGHPAAIGRLQDALGLVTGELGTVILPD